MVKQSLTPTERAALVWLSDRTGEGVIEGKGNVIVACGEQSVVPRAVWNNLISKNFAHLLSGGRRIKISFSGRKMIGGV